MTSIDESRCRRFRRRIGIALIATASLGLAAAVGGPLAAVAEPTEKAAAPTGATLATDIRRRIESNGVVVEFAPEKALGTSGDDVLRAGDHVDIGFRIRDAANAEPLSGIYPAVWMDIREAWGREESGALGCEQKVGLFLGGTVGIRPMIDLNSYFVLVMNRDATISVIDPLVGISGITKLYAQVILKRPGADWDKTADDKRLFVSMPRANELAVVNTDTFKIEAFVPAGEHPVRVKVQPDGKYVWVGNDSRHAEESGVTVIDAETYEPVAHLATGAGHHEIEFSADSRRAFVSNRNDGTVTVVDVETLKPVKTITIGEVPISLAYSALSRALYVSDGKAGEIVVVDGERLETVARIAAEPGLGPMKLTQDDRWAFVVNTSREKVYVVDTASNRIVHTVPVSGRPYQLGMTRAFAYVRALDTEKVSMINLANLDQPEPPVVNRFAIGAKPPAGAADVSIADGIVEAAGEAAILAVSPADNTVYYYMEGMNAPMGNFRNYGHRPRAVAVVDRTLREGAPGYYSAKVQIPSAGTYDVIFLLDTPRVLHCFSLTAEPNPLLDPAIAGVEIDYLLDDRTVRAGETLPLRFRMADPASGELWTGLEDVRVLYYAAPGQHRTEVAAVEITEGVYEAALQVPRSGAYYVYVASATAKVKFADLPFLTLRAMRARPTPAADDGAVREGG